MTTAAAAEWRVSVGEHEVTARCEPAEGEQRAVFVCGHGAGGNMLDRGMQRSAAALRTAGLSVVRFNFPYSERKGGRPDPMPMLKATVAAVAERARAEVESPIVLGGRSMGGRAASMLVADGFACDGLLLLAYPLHPAGQPEKLRDAHLPDIRVPVLCVNGTRDALCRRDLMDAVLPRVETAWTMHWVEGADHSFHVLRSSGRNDAAVMDEIAAVTREWLDGMSWSG